MDICEGQYKSDCIVYSDVLFLGLPVREPQVSEVLSSVGIVIDVRADWQLSTCTVTCQAFLDSMVEGKFGSLPPELLSSQLIIGSITAIGAVYIRRLPTFF